MDLLESHRILLISTQDYIHHPIPSRHHYIFEELATRHEVHVPHFHVSRGKTRPTRLHVHEATIFPVRSPLLHYTLNAPYHYRVMAKIIRDEDIDVVVAAHILAASAAIRPARKEGIPVIFDLKDWFPDSAAEYYKNRYLKELIRRSVLHMTKKNLDRSDFIITVSPSLVDRLSDHHYASTLITNGVDTDIFRPKDGRKARDDLGIPQGTFVIGFVGAIERWFALDDVIRALPDLIAKNPDILLLIVGGGLFTGYMQELKCLIRDLGLDSYVRFTGLIDYPLLPDYIAAMDVCLIPFAKWGEFALPNKFFEYSACGKPIVMTPIPDVEKIGGPNLFVYRSRSEFLGHVGRIMADPPSFSLDMEGFSWKSRAREFEKIFDRLTGEATPRSRS